MVVHGERLSGKEEEAVEFANGFGQPEKADESDEKIDGLGFQFRKRFDGSDRWGIGRWRMERHQRKGHEAHFAQ